MIVFIWDKYCSDIRTQDIAQALLSRHFGKQVALDYNTDKKPYLVGLDKNVSISHSNRVWVMAVSYDVVGIDVELIINRDYIAIARKMSWQLPKDILSFYKAWTAYEARFKAGANIKVTHYPILEEFIICVASDEQSIRWINIQDFQEELWFLKK